MFTPQQAADRVGVARTTITRALENGDLRGIRDPRGRWRIEPESLNAWAAMRPDRSLIDHVRNSVRSEGKQKRSDADIIADAALKAAEIRAEVAEAKLSYVEAERDRLATLLAEAINRPRRRFWPWS